MEQNLKQGGMHHWLWVGWAPLTRDSFCLFLSIFPYHMK